MDAPMSLLDNQPNPDRRGVASRLRSEFDYAYTQLRPRQDEWTRFHANYRGQYIGVDFDAEQSDVYPKITRMAVGMAMSKILPVLLPTGEDFWEISPSEEPEMFEALVKRLGEQAPTPEQIAEFALGANERMRSRIRDDIQEMHFDEQVFGAVLDFCLFGTMVWRGPTASKRKKKSWDVVPNKDGGFTIKKREKDDSKRPVYDHIPVRSFVPDPAADCVDEMTYAWVEHVVNANELRKMITTSGFDKKEVMSVLMSRPDGNYVPQTDEQDETTVNEKMSPDKKGRYRLLERWGWLNHQDMVELGISNENADPSEYKMCQVWICDEYIFFAKEASYYETVPFLVAPYEKMPGMLHGRGVAEQIEDPQKVLCSLVRALVDNVGFGVAPLGEVRVDKLVNGQGSPTVLSPRRLFATRRASEHGNDGGQAVNLYSVPVIAGEIIQAMDFFLKLAEYQISMPFGLNGMSTPGGSGVRTIGQQTQLYQQAENFVRVVITSLDKHFVTPYINGIYDWEMEYNPDVSIKGDFAVVARGAQGAMEREVEIQKLMETGQILMGGGPDTAGWLNVPAFVEAINRRKQIKDPIVFTPEEKAEIEKQQAALNAQKAYAAEDAKKFKAQTPYSDALTQLATSLQDGEVAKPAAMAEAYRALGVKSEPLYAALSIAAQEAIQKAKAVGAVNPQQETAAGEDFIPPIEPDENKPAEKPSEADQQQQAQQAPMQDEGGNIEDLVRSAMQGKNISSLPAGAPEPVAPAGPVEEPMPEAAPIEGM